MFMPKKRTPFACLKWGATFIAGAALGVATTTVYNQKKHLSTKKILAKIKAQFLKEGTVEVSYIEEIREELARFALKYEIYRGGIIRKEDERYINYEFTADANTGTVISIERKEIDYSTLNLA